MRLGERRAILGDVRPEASLATAFFTRQALAAWSRNRGSPALGVAGAAGLGYDRCCGIARTPVRCSTHALEIETLGGVIDEDGLNQRKELQQGCPWNERAVYGRSHFSDTGSKEYAQRCMDEHTEFLIETCMRYGVNAVELPGFVGGGILDALVRNGKRPFCRRSLMSSGRCSLLSVAYLILLFVAANTSIAAQPNRSKAYRTWTDSTGKHSTEAAFVSLEDGKVRLRKRDGKGIVVPMVRLSEADQRIAKEQAAEMKPGTSGATVGKAISRRVNLDGPGNTGAMPCDVVQVLDSNGDPSEYFMDVDSVVCADAKCEIVTVRIHFDPLGNYERYELPSGGNLTKWGHKPFSPADHENLHQILSDPYSQLKSIGWDQITMPKSSAAAGDDVDGISGATVLSKRNIVVVGAAYTCCTLWHWSHGEVENVIRDMTISASDKQDLIRYLHSGEDKYVVFAIDQLRMQNLFDAETIAAVVHVMRHGSERLADPALSYLAKASSETGVDYFFCCCEDECLVADSDQESQVP